MIVKIGIASKNPVKIQAVENAFAKVFPRKFTLQSIETDSGIGSQPLNNEDTIKGAKNRAKNCQETLPECDVWIGIEGGIEDTADGMTAFAWVALQTSKLSNLSRTGTFILPEAVAELIREGMELGEADDIVFQEKNSKQNNGAIGLLTGNIIDRVKLYEDAVIMVVIPLLNPHLYE